MTTTNKTRRVGERGLFSKVGKLFSRSGAVGVKARRQKATIEEGVQLSFIRSGAGRPMVFAPGWTMTSGFFKPQIEHFSKHNDVVSFDPRSHGESSHTLGGNNYTQHGKDLNNFLEVLGLTDVVLVGWSFGVLGIYSYIEQFGESNVRALVLIDQGPASLPSDDYSWAIGGAPDLQGFVEALRDDRTGFVGQFLGSCFCMPPAQKDLRWMTNESLRTPENAAVELIYDGWLRDYRETARKISSPVLNIVREPWEQDAGSFIASMTPNWELFTLGQHLMFWEFKEDVNARIAKFLERV